MADEATDALIPEAPSTEAAAPTEAPAPDPYEKRYNDLRSEFDRKNALLDRATKQGDVEAIRALGFEYDEPEPEDPTPNEYEDPYAEKFSAQEKQLAELTQWKQQQEAERVASSIRAHVDSLSTEQGVNLTDKDKEYIFAQAVGGEQIGADQTKAAFDAHVAYVNSLRQSFEEEYIPTKTTTRPGTGQAASKQPDLDNPQERREWMKAQLGM